jgi:UDP-N-acetylglucosamine--N-acetylmuramyl-(pentapeptide) pyrophosphoryl-undecaprenol N-acetylglucosamine transferase
VPTESPHILFAGGGTGGHLYPALAIADEIKTLAPRSRILFVGTSGKIEARVVPQRGYDFRTIWISGVHRRWTFSNLLVPMKIAVACAQSFFLIKHWKPDVVVGTGGYVCGPVVAVASLLGIPVIVHESNSYPGLTTRLLAHRATKVLVAFDETKRWLKRVDNVELVGTPTRSELGRADRAAAVDFFSLNTAKKTVLVFGGSLGAASINSAIMNLLDELQRNNAQLIWQTGQSDFERVRTAVGTRAVGWVGPYIDRMDYAYAAADVAVCRAGALTIAELTRVGLPAILVPYPRAAADHQTANARTLVEAGAALMVRDAEVHERLGSELTQLLMNDERRTQMAEASKTLGRPEAGTLIARAVLKLVG